MIAIQTVKAFIESKGIANKDLADFNVMLERVEQPHNKQDLINEFINDATAGYIPEYPEYLMYRNYYQCRTD
jgi:hypothetical protein